MLVDKKIKRDKRQQRQQKEGGEIEMLEEYRKKARKGETATKERDEDKAEARLRSHKRNNYK